MAYFAKLDENNIVIAVHIVNNSIITINDNENEQLGIDFLTNLYGHSKWKQTSYNKSFRKNYAGIGFFYDENRDAFIPEKVYNSWVLDENTCLWQPPYPYPDGEENENIAWVWDDDSMSWVDQNSISQIEGVFIND